jgi:hypothetical protein
MMKKDDIHIITMASICGILQHHNNYKTLINEMLYLVHPDNVFHAPEQIKLTFENYPELHQALFEMVQKKLCIYCSLDDTMVIYCNIKSMLLNKSVDIDKIALFSGYNDDLHNFTKLRRHLMFNLHPDGNDAMRNAKFKSVLSEFDSVDRHELFACVKKQLDRWLTARLPHR